MLDLMNVQFVVIIPKGPIYQAVSMWTESFYAHVGIYCSLKKLTLGIQNNSAGEHVLNLHSLITTSWRLIKTNTIQILIMKDSISCML